MGKQLLRQFILEFTFITKKDPRIVIMEKMVMCLVRPVARQMVAKTTVLERVVNRRSYEEIYRESIYAALHDYVFHRVRFTGRFCRIVSECILRMRR